MCHPGPSWPLAIVSLPAVDYVRVAFLLLEELDTGVILLVLFSSLLAFSTCGAFPILTTTT